MSAQSKQTRNSLPSSQRINRENRQTANLTVFGENPEAGLAGIFGLHTPRLLSQINRHNRCLLEVGVWKDLICQIGERASHQQIWNVETGTFGHKTCVPLSNDLIV